MFILVDDHIINLNNVDLITPDVESLQIEFAFNDGCIIVQYSSVNELVEALRALASKCEATPLVGAIVKQDSSSL